MEFVLLFLVAGLVATYFLARYEKKNSNAVEDILRANKNVPPLFMLRSAELKINAIKTALLSDWMAASDVKQVAEELEGLLEDYKNRDITLAVYYTKLGALLIRVNELKAVPAEAWSSLILFSFY